DAHHWLEDEACGGVGALLHEISATGESVLDEFEKVESIRQQSDAAMREAVAGHRTLLGRMQPDSWNRIEDFVEALGEISRQRGHLLTIRELRYIVTDAIDRMGEALEEAQDRVGAATGAFLGSDAALQPFEQRLGEIDDAALQAQTASELAAEIE